MQILDKRIKLAEVRRNPNGRGVCWWVRVCVCVCMRAIGCVLWCIKYAWMCVCVWVCVCVCIRGGCFTLGDWRLLAELCVCVRACVCVRVCACVCVYPSGLFHNGWLHHGDHW